MDTCTMNSFSLLCLLILLCGARANMFNFSSPIHYVDSCGPTGSWSIEGKVTLSSSDLDFFAPKLIFRTTNDLCSIDVYSCGQNLTSLANVTDVCLCTDKTGSVLSVVVKRQLRANETGQMLQVVLPSLDIFNPVNTQVNIGLVPSIHEANATLTYAVDSAPQLQPLLTSQNLSVCEDVLHELTVCARDLPPGSSVTFTSGSREIRSPGPCVYDAERFNFTDVGVHDVIVTLDDNLGCPVKETFIFHVYAKDCTTTPVPSTQAPTTTTVTTTTTTSTTTVAPTSCKSPKLSLPREVVTLPSGVSVLCDTVTDGGGWIVFQRRTTSAVSFNKNWVDYKNGFGDLSGNFWLGLEKVHGLCGSTQDKCELRIDLKYQGSSYFAEYSSFYVTGESDNYRLRFAGYSGTAGDAFNDTTGPAGELHHNEEFSTPDRNTDNNSYSHGVSCASHYQSGWWFNSCMRSNLNGLWGNNQDWKGLVWYTLSQKKTVSYSEMKFRLK